MQNNPLRQFFRRPAVYLKLPSQGKNYEPGVLEIPENGEFPVYPMTAIDEIGIRTPDALLNGNSVVDLIKSCIPGIKDPWKLNSNDLDAVLIAIRTASGNQTLDIDSVCPKCQEVNRYGLNLLAVLTNLKYGDYDSVLEINDLKMKFRPLTYKEMSTVGAAQFEIQKRFGNIETMEEGDEKSKLTFAGLKEITELTMDTLALTVEYIDTPNSRVDNREFIKDFLRNCDGSIFIALRDHNAKLKMTTELKPIDIKCPSCEHEYKQPYSLNPADFFV